jgi:hypothetical protein
MKYLLAVTALATVACNPLPEGRQIDASEASALVLKFYNSTAPSPDVFVVPPDPSCGAPGSPEAIRFRDVGSNICVSGFNDRPTRSIYLVEAKHYPLLSGSAFTHEMLHHVGYNHSGADEWPAGSRENQLIDEASKALAARPEIDRYPVDEK